MNPKVSKIKPSLWWMCCRCKHEWMPARRSKKRRPRICPRCKSAYWDVPKKAKKHSKR